MSKMKISIGDIVVFDEYNEKMNHVFKREGEVVGISKVALHKDLDKVGQYIFEVKREYADGTRFLRPYQIQNKKRYIYAHKDEIQFKIPNGDSVLCGIITNIIKSYDNENNIKEIKYIAKCSNDSTYTINETDIIKDEHEIIVIDTE